MKITRVFVIALVLLVVLIFAGWKMRTFFLQNHVTFLLNQKEVPEALRLVNRLQLKNPDSPQLQFLKVKALTIAGHYTDSLALRVTDEIITAEPEILYWRALGHYHVGNESASRKLASQFLSSGSRLSNPESLALIRQIAGQKSPEGDYDLESNSFRMMFDTEKAIYLAFAASAQLAAGRTDLATQLYESAFSLGLRSDKVLHEAVRAAALSGASQSADMFIAFTSPVTLDQLFHEFQNDYYQFRSPTMVIDAHQAYGSGGRIARARSLAWVTVPFVKQDIPGRRDDATSIVIALQKEFPYDLPLQMRAAELYETIGRKDDARALYDAVHNEVPSLTAAFRIWTLDGLEDSEISRRLDSILKQAQPDAIISTGTLTTGLKSDRLEPAVPAVFSFNIPNPDSYNITVIARGTETGSHGSLLKVEVDGQILGIKYISRNTWDGYSLPAQLSEGEHEIELKIESASTESSGVLDLMAIVVIPPVTRK